MSGRIVIDNTSIEVSRLSFGTSSLHHIFFSAQRQALLHGVEAAGITHFDTAPYYGYGLAECDLGKFMVGRRSRFTVSTKIGLYPLGPSSTHIASVLIRKTIGKLINQIALPEINWQVARARESLSASLKRLQSDYVDFLFLHEPDFALLNTDEILSWLEQEQIRGTIRAWGVAGVRARVAPFVVEGHLLARVVQTQDSLDQRQADFLTDIGRRFQFTYGYLSATRLSNKPILPMVTIRQALLRNSTGSVLVSARRLRHINELSS